MSWRLVVQSWHGVSQLQQRSSRHYTSVFILSPDLCNVWLLYSLSFIQLVELVLSEILSDNNDLVIKKCHNVFSLLLFNKIYIVVSLDTNMQSGSHVVIVMNKYLAWLQRLWRTEFENRHLVELSTRYFPSASSAKHGKKQVKLTIIETYLVKR